MAIYKYTNNTNTVVHVIEEDGKSYRSMPAELVPANSPILPWITSVTEWKAFLKTEATKKREQVEQGGTVINGTPVKTDLESQGKINRVLTIAGRSPSKIIPFKTASNNFTSLNKAQIEAIADGVGDFVLACYNAESTHYTAIDALDTVVACENYYNTLINTGWPSNGN